MLIYGQSGKVQILTSKTIKSKKGEVSMKRKILASILALSMIFSMVPTAAFADGETGSDGTKQIVEKVETVGESKDKTEPGNEAPKTEEAPKAEEAQSQSAGNGESRMMRLARLPDPTDGPDHTPEPAKPDVAKIGDKGYKSLKEAIANAQNGDTIVLQANVTEDVVIPRGKEVTIDLNGKTVTNKSDHTIYNNGNLTIVGSGTVDNVTHQKAAVYNNVGATAILNGGTYDRTSENGKDDATSGGNSYYTIKNFGTMTVNGEGVTVQTAGGNKDLGRFSSLVANGWYDYKTADGKGEPKPIEGKTATLTITGGTFKGGLNTIKNDDNGEINISGGTFTNYVQAALQNHNIVTITGGKFISDAPKYSVDNCGCAADYDVGKLTITGGEFTGVLHSRGVFDDITISGGTFHDGIEFVGKSSKNVKITGDAFADKVVAQVGDVKYVSIEAAINNAKSGETVTLLANAEFDTTVTIDKNLTLDLNGNTPCSTVSTGKASIYVKDATFTLKDSTNNGAFTALSSMVIDGTNSKFVLESGNVSVTSDYGVYCKNGGSAVINGGSIESLYAPLTGNNTTGNMNFIVTGGTLTAKQGPAIYMPGQVSLKISGGTLNGGISLRMGQIDISGGKIIAIKDGIDNPKDYYSYSGNAWLPDALYVFNGTYESKDATYNNSLNINITGGEFICENGQGSAVAIYDIAKIAQNSSVKISGTAVLKTNATNRKAYQVLSLADIGVDAPKKDYGNSEFAGKVKSELSGGSYNVEPDAKYLAERFETVKNAETNMYEVGEHKAEKVADKVEPTCTETGKMEYYKCNTCGKFYVLENGAYKEVTEADLVIPALGHKMTKHEEVKATCTEKGMKAYYECSTCGKLYEDEAGTKEVTDKNTLVIDIDATNHKTKFVAEVAAGCEKEGVKAHYECERCGKLFTDAEGKNEVKAADLVIGATGHHWGEWKVVKAATTREAGIEQAICDYCGGPWQKEIPVRATASTGTATRPSNSGSTGTKDNSSSSTSSTKENANPTKADTSVADVKRSEEVVSTVKENVKVADQKATVDKNLINKVKGEKGAAVVLPIASATGESVTSTEIAKDAVKAVMDNGSDLIVELTDATVKLDNETLKAVYAQADGDSIEIRAVKTELTNLTEAQKKALDNYDTAVVVELQIYSNGKYIANFNGGIATIKIPFTPAEGVSADEYTVYYVGGDGKLTAVASEYVDGYMIISTGHFSSYAIVRTAEKVADSSSASSQPREQTGSSFPVVPVVIAVVALICLFVLLRKKNKED